MKLEILVKICERKFLFLICECKISGFKYYEIYFSENITVLEVLEVSVVIICY